MNDIFFKLARFMHHSSPQLKSFYYRHRALLQKKCGEISAQTFFKSEAEWNLFKQQYRYGPLQFSDLSPSTNRKALEKIVKSFPKDPKFYAFFKNQMDLWIKFSDQSLEDFLKSTEGKRWFERRKLLKRKPLFELDAPYKTSKRSALEHESKVRGLLRKHPLLRWEDLRDLGVKNAQAIVQRFPQRAFHRQNFLKKLTSQIDSE